MPNTADADPTSKAASTLALAECATESFAECCLLCSLLSQGSSSDCRCDGDDVASADASGCELTCCLPAASGAAASAVDRTLASPTGVLRDLEPASDAEGQARDPRISKRVWALVASLAVLLLAAVGLVAFFSAGGFAMFSSVSAEDVEETLRADPGFMGGFASNEYVDPSEYELSDVRILSSSEGSDGVVRLQVAADLSNESFSSECNVAMDFVRVRDISDADGFSKVPVPEDAAGTDWVGRVVSVDADTRAIRAVDFDPEVPDGFDPSFDEEAQTSTFVDTSTVELWFADVSDATTYTYRFDGSEWGRGEASHSREVRYKGLEGSYSPAGGDAGEFARFSIDGLNALDGTFTVEYEKDASFLSSDGISGSIECSVTPVEVSSAYEDCRQEDGFVYVFEGTGTSSGGDGEARISGALTPDGGLVFDFAGDYTEHGLFGGERTARTEKSGTFAK